MNDQNKTAYQIMKKNVAVNRVATKIKLANQEANSFLLDSTGFDYIDIDPFGTPNPFLDNAVKKIARGGILAITATDTSALAGAYPKACQRKYWAMPAKDELKHEVGLRILARKVQLIGAQYGKALMPIYSYALEHYMRIFFQCEKSKEKVDKIIAQHGMIGDAGPMWLGPLWSGIAQKMARDDLLAVIAAEAKIPVVGFYDIHALCKQLKTKSIPKTEELIKKIKAQRYKVAKTHFSPVGLRTTMPEDKFRALLKKLS